MTTSPTTTFGGFTHYARVLAATLALAVVALVGGGGAQAASAQTITNEFGTLHISKVTGHTTKGATFAGKYHVTKFVTRNGHLKAVGHLSGTLTKKSGATRAVSERVRMPVNMSATRAANTRSSARTGQPRTGSTSSSDRCVAPSVRIGGATRHDTRWDRERCTPWSSTPTRRSRLWSIVCTPEPVNAGPS